MGEVYEALDTELERRVAVKVARLADEGDRLLCEGRVLAQLVHPNVVRVYDAGRHDGAAYIVMELASGSSLRRWMCTGRPPTARQVSRMFRGLAHGCAAIHDLGLTHRDIKPDNILVTETGQGLLSDFGLATAAGSGGSAGTPGYIAPEVEAGGAATAQSDQFALCVTLAEALRTPPRVPRRIRRVIERGTRVDPAQRFPSMSALADALVPPRASAWVLPLVLIPAALGLVIEHTRAPLPCTWSEVSWPRQDDAQWVSFRRKWIQAAEAACQGDLVAKARPCLLELRRDALSLSRAARADQRPQDRAMWAQLDPLLCLEPQPDEARALKATIREQLVRSAVARHQMRYEDARAALASVSESVRAVGDDPLAIAALSESGRVARAIGEAERARDRLESAYWLARRLDQPGLAADAAIELAQNASDDDLEPAERRWLEAGAAALERLGDDHGRWAEYERVASLVHHRRNRGAASVAAARRAVDHAKQMDPPSTQELVRAEVRLGGALQATGEIERARELLEHAAQTQRTLQASPRQTGLVLYTLAIFYISNLGDDARGRALLEEVASLVDTEDAPPSLLAGKTYWALGHTYVSAGEVDKARRAAERAAVHYESLYPDEHQWRLDLITLRASTALAEGDDESAMELAEEGMLLANRTQGARGMVTGSMTGFAARVAARLGRHRLAVTRRETELSIYEENAGPDNPMLVQPLMGLGDAYLALGQPRRARAQFERLLSLDLPPAVHAQARQKLSQTLVDSEERAASQTTALTPDR